MTTLLFGKRMVTAFAASPSTLSLPRIAVGASFCRSRAAVLSFRRQSCLAPPSRMSSASSQEAASQRKADLRGPEGIFSKIIAKQIPADIVYEDEKCLAFKDLNPQAPTHLLVIPKVRIALLEDANQSDGAILGHLMLAAAEAARLANLDTGYRVIVNNGYDGLQSVGHLHLHVVGGCKLNWGPFHD